ncbi:DUF3173 family protein [Lactococcus petauri]|uniref:DUF3173 family protein n=1 Tax=Lactococcus petauri TaxID=1940789 RepID=UPI0009BD2CA0
MFITKQDLMKLGFGPYQAYMLIKQAKALMVKKGYAYYNSNGVGKVPKETVEEILGTKLAIESVAESA